MRRISVWCLIGLAMVACSRRPLSGGRTKLPTDARVMGADAVTVDAPSNDLATIVPDAGAADARADVHVDVAPPAPDAGVNDVPADRDSSADKTAGDTSAADAAPRPDGGCAGNGLPARTGSLFAPPVTITLPDPQQVSGFSASGIGVGDINGDGRADIVVGTHHPALVVYSQLPDGRLGTPVSYPVSTVGSSFPFGPALLDLGDLNGDGRMDVVFHRENGIGFMPGNASGGLGPEQLLPKPSQGIGGADLRIADLDGDGRSDLVAMPYQSNGVEVRLQDAAGALATTGFFRCAGDSYHQMAIGDANGDGRPDIALANLDGEICLLLQRSAGDFGSALSLKVGGQIDSIGIGNFGAGGCGPAIAFSIAGNRPNSRLGMMTWVSGMFSPPVYQEAYDIPGDMAVADVDGDGRSDLVLMHIVWLKVGVFRGAAAGGLGAEQLYDTTWINHGADRLAIGDVNGDGRPDIVSADFDLMILYHR